jgi:hypothetical protein
MNQHLSNPHTSEARNYIHQRLKNFASAANSSGRCSGLAQFIGCISDPEVIKKILAWINLYTPIRIDTSGKVLLFLVPSNLIGTYNLAAANLNPYYSINIPSIIERESSVAHRQSHRRIGSRSQLSDKQFAEKNIKLAFEKFFNDPCLSNKNHLIEQIQKFNLVPVARGSVTVSGGLPSLGRR